MIPVSNHYSPLANFSHPKTLMERNLQGLNLSRMIELRKLDKKIQECFHAKVFALGNENHEPNLCPPLEAIEDAPCEIDDWKYCRFLFEKSASEDPNVTDSAYMEKHAQQIPELIDLLENLEEPKNIRPITQRNKNSEQNSSQNATDSNSRKEPKMFFLFEQKEH